MCYNLSTNKTKGVFTVLIVLLLLAACLLFRRRLVQLFTRGAAFAAKLGKLRKPVAALIREEYHPQRKPGAKTPTSACTRPAQATRPAAVCHPLIKYVSIDAPQAPPTCVPVSKLPFCIGRSKNCDLSIDDQTLSQTHFEVIARGENYGVRNLSETNGLVLVNEQTQRIGVRLKEAGRVQMIDPACGYLRFWAGGQFFQLTLSDSRAPALM